MSEPVRPPLACRPSPPQVGRIPAARLPATRATVARHATVDLDEAAAPGHSPDLWGRCPAGQRGARRDAACGIILRSATPA